VLCGERPRLRLPLGTDLGKLAPLETLHTADTVMVPGVEQPLAPRSKALLDALRTAHAGGARVVSFCGGAFLLGLAGILEGRRCDHALGVVRGVPGTFSTGSAGGR